MGRNLNDNYGWITELKDELARLKSGAFLENSSISDGQLRLIRATLLMQGGALLKGEGTFDWTGPGSIAGNWEVLGGGVIRVGGVLISPVGGGRIMIGQGPVGIILDGGAGTLTMGNIRLEGGKVYVGTGANQVVIDGATGEVQVGTSMKLDPSTDGGAVLFSNLAKLFSNASAIGMRKGNSSVTIGETLASMLVGGKSLSIGQDRIDLVGARVTTDPDEVKMYLGLSATNELLAISSAIGGPGGQLSWPLPPSKVSSEYGPREVTIEGASEFHEGIDFSADEGTPIPSAGAGRVTFAGPNGGYGNHVRVDHGRGLVTTYSHMATLPRVSVGQIVPTGYDLGPVGDTGVSGAPHLHFEVQVNGQPVNPRSKLPAA